MICAASRSFSQPGLPQSHGSMRPFCSPQDSSCLTAHSPAAFRLGDPVGRGPYRSVSTCAVRRMCELVVASCRIFQYVSWSMRSCACNDTTTATTHERRRHILTHWTLPTPRLSTLDSCLDSCRLLATPGLLHLLCRRPLHQLRSARMPIRARVPGMSTS